MQIGKDIERYDWYYNRELISEVIIDRQNKEEYHNSTRICELLNQQNQRIAELEEQLKNAIVPKFKIGQEVWFVNETLEEIHNGKVNAFECYKFKDRPYEFWYDIDYVDSNTEYSDEVSDEFIFETEQEALAKLQGVNYE